MTETAPIKQHQYVMPVQFPHHESTPFTEKVQEVAAFVGMIVVESPSRRQAVNLVTDILHEYRINHAPFPGLRSQTWEQVNRDLRRETREDYTRYV